MPLADRLNAPPGLGAERKSTVNAYAINKANIIAAAPTGTEGVNAAPALQVMGTTALASMSAMGQGINSALTGMGAIGYRWANRT